MILDGLRSRNGFAIHQQPLQMSFNSFHCFLEGFVKSLTSAKATRQIRHSYTIITGFVFMNNDWISHRISLSLWPRPASLTINTAKRTYW